MRSSRVLCEVEPGLGLRVYAHGVGTSGAHGKTSSTRVANIKRDNALYRANKKSDRDGDGIACEAR